MPVSPNSRFFSAAAAQQGRSPAEVRVKPLPKTEHSLVLRTDFSDDAAWEAACAAIQEPNGDGFRAYVDCVSDPAYAGLTVEQFVALDPKGADHTFAFLVDRVTLTDPDRPVLVVDLYDEPGQ